MRVVGFLVRVLIVLAVFALTGWGMAQLMITHAVARGTPEYDIRLAAYTGGLFVGGSAAVLVGISMILWDRRKARQRRGE